MTEKATISNLASEIELKIHEMNSVLDEAYAIRVNDLEQAFEKVYEVLRDSEINEIDQLVARSQTLLGLFYMIKGDYENSRNYSNKAILYYRSIDDRKGIADATFNIASTYYKSDNYYKGLDLLLESKQLYGELGDHTNSARVLKSIGTIYDYFGDTSKAIETYERCIDEALVAKEPNIESNAYNPLSGNYLKIGEIERAMELACKSISIKTLTNDQRGLAFAIYARGKVYLKLNQIDTAITDFNESLVIQTKFGDRLGQGMVLNKLGLAYFNIGEYEKAIFNLNKALEIGKKYKINLISYKANHTMYLIYKELGAWNESLGYLEAYNTLKESIIFRQTSDIISSYEALFKLEKMEREILVQEEKYKIIEKKNAELDSFFYKVSHDLKGPISSLLGLQSIINYEKFSPEAIEYFEIYKGQFKRLNMIVMDLINLTKMQTMEENNVKIDFDHMIKGCVDSYISHAKFKSIQFNCSIESGLNFVSPWVVINTIFQNLIENAIKYSKNGVGNFVNINVSNFHGKLKIEVADNGIGISDEHQALIFNMFYRANNDADGTGLGLYILKRAVERLKGEVSISSTLNQGTSFVVLLPY